MNLVANKWQDYKLIDASYGKRLEKWGDFLLSRPDPAVIWSTKSSNLWNKSDAEYKRSSEGGGSWKFNREFPQSIINYNDIKFYIKPMGFKHVGVFPEQAPNWDWAYEKLQTHENPKVLNLFAYTGIASLFMSKAGASVTQVDSSKNITTMAKQNADLNGISNIRYIVEDCRAFVMREIRRGNTYDAMVLDPPSYGRGSKGEVWQIEQELQGLLELCKQVLSPNPLFIMLNSYTTSLSPALISSMLQLVFEKEAQGYELTIPVDSKNILLPSGVVGRVEF